MKRETKEWLLTFTGGGSVFEPDVRDILASDARQAATIRRLRKAIVEIHAVTKPIPLAQLPRDTAPLIWEVEAIARAALRPAKARK